ncbi:MAG: YgiQ family radical SAM protein [Eggerthellaceae bacterium]|nr:YgiQ family radical SAM protein [Eggerthellaceae bacterium]
MTREAALARGWEQVDFVYVTGDAYVDHSSFGTAIIARLLESKGFSVGIIAQPDWKDPASVTEFGAPRLGFLVSAGNMDSMVNHYTVAKKRRHQDAYTPGGKPFARPDHAVVAYSQLIRRSYKDAPIILGGVEASLRRLAHYDYWSDKLKRSVLLDSGADLISYGMGEHSIVEIAEALQSGLSIRDLTFIPGTVFRAKSTENLVDFEMLPSWDEVRSSKRAFAESFAIQYANSDPFTGKTLVEDYGREGLVVQLPPAMPLSTAEMDAVYRLPFTGTWHPAYDKDGGVPALAEVKFSLTSNRGCFGECAFCALTFHQGRIVQSRSHESLLAEAEAMTADPAFKGYINDVGGPTANFRQPACAKQMKAGACTNKRCLSPVPCKAMKPTHKDYVKLLRKLRALPGVKKVFVRSGIRFDYVMEDPNGEEFLHELVNHHVSGQLRVAPEHVAPAVLEAMGKPPRAVYDRFCEAFQRETEAAGKKQYVVPYLMSSHPGSTLKEAVELAEYVRDMGFNPEQVQDFYPTPSTVATCMYYTGLDPLTLEPIYVPKTPHEKALQRALIQYRNPANYDLVREALTKAGRTDLIGWDEKSLIRPKRPSGLRPARDFSTPGQSPSGRNDEKGEKPATSQHPKRSGKPAVPRHPDQSAKPRGPKGTKPANRQGRPPKANGHKGGIR